MLTIVNAKVNNNKSSFPYETKHTPKDRMAVGMGGENIPSPTATSKENEPCRCSVLSDAVAGHEQDRRLPNGISDTGKP